MTCSPLPLVTLLLAGMASAQAPLADPALADSGFLEQGGVLIRPEPAADGRGGAVSAALLVDAPADLVFAALSRCRDALAYMPKLNYCRDWPADDGSRMVEHEVDFGWYAPRLRYVFRADLEPGRRIVFRQVSGDFRVNEGIWELRPSGDRTLVLYRARMEAPSFIPGWLARATLTREFPRMLSELRRLCEDRARVARQQTSSRVLSR
jgi:hypothetical protein